MPVARQAVVDTAAGWVGMLEETGNNDIWFSRDWGIEGQAWCFAFTQSGFYYAPRSPDGKLPHESMYCPYGIAWARENSQAIEVGGAGPQPGDIIFFSWDMVAWPRWRAGTGDHVGIVEAWDGGDLVWTIEGNVGNPQGVYRKVRSISETVVCFWRPTVFGDGPLTALPPEDEDVNFDPNTHGKWLEELHGSLSMLRDLYNGWGGAERITYPNVLGEKLEALHGKVGMLEDLYNGWGGAERITYPNVLMEQVLAAVKADHAAPGEPGEPGSDPVQPGKTEPQPIPTPEPGPAEPPAEPDQADLKERVDALEANVKYIISLLERAAPRPPVPSPAPAPPAPPPPPAQPAA